MIIIGYTIENIFQKISEKYSHIDKRVLAFMQFLTAVSTAYYLHVNTSNAFSKDFQIGNPSVLFSSFIINLQKTMFTNLGLTV